jgi:hypothetical protein
LNLPKEAITEFKDLYQKKLNRELTNDEAQVMAKELLTLYTLTQGHQNIL